jgi:hypothetical protein
MSPLRLLTTVGVFVATLAAALPVRAQPAVISQEYELKAKILVVLTKTIGWPTDAHPPAGKPLVIGILGRDLFTERGVNQLEQVVAAEQKRKWLLQVQQFDSVADLKPCHVLYVSRAANPKSAEKTVADRLAKALERTKGSPVLIVTETDGLAQKGSAVNLVFDATKNKIRLEINPDAATRASLELQPALLRMATIVRDPMG